MARDATPSAPAHGVSEETYEALLATLSASAVGRSFLAEYARRNRAADTETLLAAMARLEAMIAAQSAEPAAPAESLAAAEPATADALVKPGLLEKADEAATEEAPVVDAGIPEVTWEAPSPADPFIVAAELSEAPAEASEAPSDLVIEATIEALALSPDVAEEIAPPDEAAALTPDTLEEAALVELAALSFEAPEQAATPRDEPEETMPLRDPLEQIMALSEEERIALFS
jgi:hypothetical protein